MMCVLFYDFSAINTNVFVLVDLRQMTPPKRRSSFRSLTPPSIHRTVSVYILLAVGVGRSGMTWSLRRPARA